MQVQVTNGKFTKNLHVTKRPKAMSFLLRKVAQQLKRPNNVALCTKGTYIFFYPPPPLLNLLLSFWLLMASQDSAALHLFSSFCLFRRVLPPVFLEKYWQNVCLFNKCSIHVLWLKMLRFKMHLQKYFLLCACCWRLFVCVPMGGGELA